MARNVLWQASMFFCARKWASSKNPTAFINSAMGRSDWPFRRSPHMAEYPFVPPGDKLTILGLRGCFGCAPWKGGAFQWV
jgi:hypothetical protein